MCGGLGQQLLPKLPRSEADFEILRSGSVGSATVLCSTAAADHIAQDARSHVYLPLRRPDWTRLHHSMGAPYPL